MHNASAFGLFANSSAANLDHKLNLLVVTNSLPTPIGNERNIVSEKGIGSYVAESGAPKTAHVDTGLLVTLNKI